MKAGEPFIVDVEVTNDCFLPKDLSLDISLLDGLLETIQKDISSNASVRIPRRSTQTYEIECLIRKGDVDWYKEEYNIQVFAYQKRFLLGWTQVSQSSVQGIHVQTAFTEKEKVHITSIVAPEILNEETTLFPVNVTIENQATYDYTISARVDLVQKPAMLPELESITSIGGLGSERKELGRSSSITIVADSTETLEIPCSLRAADQDLKEFVIETQLYVTIQGEEYLVDSSMFQGIIHQQPFLQEHSFSLLLGLFAGLLLLILLVLLIRIIYPAYYIKRKKLQREKKRLQKQEE